MRILGRVKDSFPRYIKYYELKIRVYEMFGFKLATCHLRVRCSHTEPYDIPSVQLGHDAQIRVTTVMMIYLLCY